MPHVEFERENKNWHGLCTDSFDPLIGINGRTDSKQCKVCVTPVAGAISGCRAIWTPDSSILYRSDFTMPSWTYTGNNDEEYEAVEAVGPGLFDEDYEIWANSSQYLDGLTISQEVPLLLWSFLGPLDSETNCTLKSETVDITTNTFVEPSITSGVDQWNVTESLGLTVSSFFAHDTPADGEHRVSLDILHEMKWEAVVSGVGEGYHRHRFEVGSRLNWFEANQTQAYWQTTDPHSATIALTSDATTGSYWRKEPADAPGSDTFVRSIPWSHGSSVPSASVARRRF